MSVEIRTAAAADGAAAALAAATTLLLEGGALDVSELGDGLDAGQVVAGAAALLAKVVVDVERVLNLSRDGTLHRLGLWVATQDVPR